MGRMVNAAGLALNVPDMVCGLVVVIGLFVGLFVGLFRQSILLAAAYVAALLADRLYVALGPTIPLAISTNATVRLAVALGGLFVLLLIALIWAAQYIPNPIGMTSKLTYLSGRAAAAGVGVVWSLLLVAMIVTALVLSLGGSWGVEQEQTQLRVKYALRQSSIVQVLRVYVWPISEDAQTVLPLGPFLPN
jgi:uncharacterized membrane protein required for colicin V production